VRRRNRKAPSLALPDAAKVSLYVNSGPFLQGQGDETTLP